MDKEIKKQIGKRFLENIEDFEIRFQLAMKTMEKYRCPLYHADSALYDECEDVISDYCVDNNIDIDMLDYDVEEIIFDMD